MYKSATDAICSISETGVVIGINEGDYLVSAWKAATGIPADTSSKQISNEITKV